MSDSIDLDEEVSSSGASASLDSVQLFQDETSSLSNGSDLDSGWLDMEQWSSYKISIFAGGSDLSFVITSSEISGGYGVNDIVSTTPLLPAFLATLPIRERYMRFQVVNNTGAAVSNVKFEVFGNKTGTGASVFPDYVAPAQFSPALLTQAILRGLDQEGVYQNVNVNTAGALLTTEFGTEVARGKYTDEGWSIGTKFGRNPDIDTGSTPEDMWAGGGEYTGFNATSNEDLQINSTDNDDRGALVSSGTVTTDGSFTLVDSGATFITDGVAVGDCVINDTESAHGFVTSVVSETQLAVFRMTNGSIFQVSNSSGDSYRVANANDTGAAVVRIDQILNEDYEQQPSKYAILNGTTNVTVTVDAMRCTRAKVIYAGSSGTNEGTLRIRQASTTANIFAQVPTSGQTTVGAYTVPNGKVAVLKRIRTTITRTNGSAGSATIQLNAREPYGAWRAVRVFELQTGAATEFTNVGGIVFTEGFDVKYTIADVSDNNTVAEGAFEFYLIDE